MSQAVEGDMQSDALVSEFRVWYEASWLRPALEFTAVFGLWILALFVGLWSGSGLMLALMALPATLAVGQLFMIGHDAGHGSYSSSRLLN
ncbi:MAG: hypothetical protein OER95_05205, partial [Acidimicrobiia bacterium]|nr:hypothetical protein [Acidimicrobiia bacterium]